MEKNYMNKLKNKFNGAKFDIEPNGVFASVKLLTTDYMLEFELKKPQKDLLNMDWSIN
ncbi:MAG: hypothetical protein ACTHYF_06820 [Ruoffia tabacinasalis]|uniref:hypothetical protein n=1 Tax=Ruoffia TaxID=2862144 RepID=UPI001485C89B|nr:hypothetical protein [Ruoffia tabacinasalis]